VKTTPQHRTTMNEQNDYESPLEGIFGKQAMQRFPDALAAEAEAILADTGGDQAAFHPEAVAAWVAAGGRGSFIVRPLPKELAALVAQLPKGWQDHAAHFALAEEINAAAERALALPAGFAASIDDNLNLVLSKK
jgi:hypothetical protein